MQMIKMTVLELLRDKLPEEYVIAIINNIVEREVLNDNADDILSELHELFDWENSSEGYDFWADVFGHLATGNGLPILPLIVAWSPNSYISTDIGDFFINANGRGHDILIRLDFSEQPRTVEARIFKEMHQACCN